MENKLEIVKIFLVSHKRDAIITSAATTATVSTNLTTAEQPPSLWDLVFNFVSYENFLLVIQVMSGLLVFMQFADRLFLVLKQSIVFFRLMHDKIAAWRRSK